MQRLVLISLLFVGCAHHALVAPSSGAVQGGLSRTQSGLTDAKKQQLEIQQKNTKAQDELARIDAKDKFLEGYRKYKALHP